MRKTILLSIVALLVTLAPAPAATHLVPAEYTTIQNAIDAAVDGDVVIVATGTYNGHGNRDIDFGGKAITVQSTDPQDPAIVASTVIDCQGTEANPHRGFNFHNSEVLDSVLAGFTITNGYGPDAIIWADSSSMSMRSAGGAIFCGNSSPTIRNCVLRGNNAHFGAGIFCKHSNPNLSNCTFTSNNTITGGMTGTFDVIFCEYSSPSVSDCRFLDNGGTAISFYDYCRPIIVNCTISNNGTGIVCKYGNELTIKNCSINDNYGFGIQCDSTIGGGTNFLTISRCILRNNGRALTFGRYTRSSVSDCTIVNNSWGGIFYSYYSDHTITNCTISGNDSFPWGATVSLNNSKVSINNCILWGNEGLLFELDSSSLSVSYSNVEGGCPHTCIPPDCELDWGPANIDADPLFLDADGADNVIGTEDDNLRLSPSSPCIDAGNNSAIPPPVFTDLDGDPRITNGTVDMGAYEGPDQGFLLSTESVTVPEGMTASFSVALAMDPLGTVEATVAHQSGDTEIEILSGEFLTFDSSNYSYPQTVTLSSVEDKDYFNGKALIWISAPEIFTVGLTATEWDNDAPTVLYVDGTASGADNGLSWTDAFADLQDALCLAAVVPQVDEISVAQGVYTPAEPLSGDRNATFQLINDLAITGGYAGFGEADPNARDIELYETILSGDLNGNDVDVNDPIDPLDDPCRSENSYHVVTGSETDETAVLDGFTVTAGHANSHWSYGHDGGGGMYIDSGSPTLTNCTFKGNFADHGGGLYNVDSSPATTNCSFTKNYAHWRGGGMYNVFSSPTVSNCTFTGNTSRYDGGGMANGGSSTFLTNCTFRNNSSSWGEGGGMENSHSDAVVVNCVFSGNSADYGGGIFNWESSAKMSNCVFTRNCAELGGGMFMDVGMFPPNPAMPPFMERPCNITLSNSTFSGNFALKGRALVCSSVAHLFPSNVQIANCILWDGGDEIRNYDDSTITIEYSNVWGSWQGTGNIDADPCFVESGYWDTNGVWVDGDYHLLPDSPCIDVGDPNYTAEPNETDLDGRPRVMGGRIDMGAYETPISAEVRFIPRTINLASKGNWLTCYIRLPEGYDVANIEPNSIFLEQHIKSEQLSVDEQKQVAIARFRREKLRGIITTGEVKPTITGQLKDGTIFEATDVIRIVDRSGRKI